MNKQSTKSNFHWENHEDLAGFAVENKKGDGKETIKVLVWSALTSDQPDFYKYVEQLSNIFLGKVGIIDNDVTQFLVLIHQNRSVDLYINDFPVAVEASIKRNMEKGDLVMRNDIADIRRLNFPSITIDPKDKLIYCFKVGWKFGLFFDLDRQNQDIDTDKMMLTLGSLYRNLSFQYLYNVLSSKELVARLFKDGWFPFIEIIGNEYKKLAAAYENNFDIDNTANSIVEQFDKDRLDKILDRWKQNTVFADKLPLLESAIHSFLQDNQSGYIACIKNLETEIEGIVRIHFFGETGKGNGVKVSELIDHVLDKGLKKSGSADSMFFPKVFTEYLKEAVFCNFDLENGKIDLSRNTSCHGVANADDYTKIKALQLILVVDQIFFYLN